MTDVHTRLFCCEFLPHAGDLCPHAGTEAIAEVTSA